MTTSPASCRPMPSMMPSTVLLPAPLWPSRPTISFSFTSKFTSSSARRSLVNCLVRFLTEIISLKPGSFGVRGKLNVLGHVTIGIEDVHLHILILVEVFLVAHHGNLGPVFD